MESRQNRLHSLLMADGLGPGGRSWGEEEYGLLWSQACQSRKEESKGVVGIVASLGAFRGLLFLLSGPGTIYADSLVLVLRVNGGSLGIRPASVGTGTVSLTGL